MRVRATLVAGLVLGALIVAATAFGSAARGPGCARVQVGSGRMCLVAGHRCNPRYERTYERHGFRCRKDTMGVDRLWIPVKDGPTHP